MFFCTQAHTFSCNLDAPTAGRSFVTQGELPTTSVAGLDPWGKADAEKWLLLREKLPQFPALPARWCPFTRPLSGGDSTYDECPELGGEVLKLTSASEPFKGW
jgi:hypothetical protein